MKTNKKNKVAMVAEINPAEVKQADPIQVAESAPAGQVLDTMLARASKLQKLVKPTEAQARGFFDWDIAKRNVASITPDIAPIERDGIIYYPGSIIPEWNDFRSSKGNSLHVGTSYNPIQPLQAYEMATEAMKGLGIEYKIDGVGSFDGDKQIFAQFASGSSGFNVKGKEYKGLFTMGKGNDETMPLCFWLTLVCVVCLNTWAMARRDARTGVRRKQTKNVQDRIKDIQKEIQALFAVQESVQATLNRMAESKITMDDATRAYLGLLNHDKAEKEMKQTGRTRMDNEIARFKTEFNNPAMGTQGETVEDLFNAVTNLHTHANLDSPQAKKDLGAWRAKVEASSEFGEFSKRKSLAFGLFATPEALQGTIQTGDAIFQGLLAKPVIVAASSVVGSQDFNRLLAK